MNDRPLMIAVVLTLLLIAISVALRAGYEMARFDEAMNRLRESRSEPEVLIASLRSWLETEIGPQRSDSGTKD